MRTVSPKIWLVTAGMLLVGAVLIVSIANRRRASTERQQIAAIGAEWEQAGKLSQADYIKLRQILSNVRSSGGVISDQDLGWSLGIMKKAPDALVRSRVLGMLGLLGERHPIPASQKTKVSEAIAPYLSSPNELDKRYAARVQKALTAH